ncbi:MAG: hypothetical protein JW793_13705 [Acidobacteria bacterium]|nr:hypothetical protein [Acidobacteriota bacterium]
MKKATIFTGVLLTIIVFTCACASKKKAAGLPSPIRYDRAYLVDLMDQYLAALVRHDPAGLPLAKRVKLVENTEVTPIGKGLWENATGPGTTDYKIHVADPGQGRVGYMGLLEENGKPIQLGVRLKLENGEITEIDHMIWRQIGDPMPAGLMKPRPGLIEPLPESEKTSREAMVQASLAYYDAIEQSDGTVAPFAEECRRHEGGIPSANSQAPLPKDAEAIGSLARFGRMKCGEQLSTGVMAYITDINQRRVAAVDEEMGLVMIFSMFNHDGEPDPLPVRNVPGYTERANEWGQFSVGAAHIYKIRSGKIHEIEAMACVGIPYQASDGWSCTSKCLADIMDRYLAALAKNDPSEAPLADDAMLVENTEKIPIGKGLWKTATAGPTDFKIIVADPEQGEVAFMGVIEENEKPTIAAIRLKVADHQVEKMDHLVIHVAQGEPLNPNMSKVRPALLERLPKLERVPNERMRAIANSYYDAIVRGNGDIAPFADECQRRENGGISANDKTQTPEEAAEDDFSVFRKMKCGEQISTGTFGYITDITDRRVFAVDEEKGLVFAFSIFRHSGEPKVMRITGVPGVTERLNEWGPFEFPAAHVLKIRGGKIHEIEAIGYFSEGMGLTSGWE